jgi:hypothetical protein
MHAKVDSTRLSAPHEPAFCHLEGADHELLLIAQHFVDIGPQIIEGLDLP